MGALPTESEAGPPVPQPTGTATVAPVRDGSGPAAASGSAGDKARLFILVSFPVWAATVIRGLSDASSGDEPVGLTAGLLAAFAVLLVAERLLTGRFDRHLHPYFAIQTGLVLAMMLLLANLDYFAILYIPLSAQAMLVFPRRVGYRWLAVFTVAMAGGLAATLGWPESVPFALLYGSAFFFVASYAAVTQQAEAARERTTVLLTDLEEAYRRLEDYAARIEALAVVEERNRLARDLHDSVTQTLYGLTLSAEAAARALDAGRTETAVDQLRDLRETAQQALQEMRLLLFELRSPVLEQEGLAAALQARLDAVEGRVGLATALAVEGDGPLPAAVEAELDRITQEALNNALKHARAKRIEVRLRQEEGRVALEIADDGVGFDPGAARAGGGFGLRGMEERAARLGGRLAVESGPGAGTRVTVEVPR